MQSLKSITIKGFKSFRCLEQFELGRLNIMVGANGSGKSNLIQFFSLLNALSIGEFQKYTMTNGIMDSYAFQGLRVTPQIEFAVEMDGEVSYLQEAFYNVIMHPTAGEHFMLEESVGALSPQETSLGSPSLESHLRSENNMFDIIKDSDNNASIRETLSQIRVYHLNDTSTFAPLRRPGNTLDHAFLRSDAANIAPYLFHLREYYPDYYKSIIYAIRAVIPFFDYFTFESCKRGQEDTLLLTWKQKGSGYPMQPYQLSDGALRFICLATALHQPDAPSVLVMDEPELGLHPEAIEVLGELITDASRTSQVLIATQSPLLLDQFPVDDVIIARRDNGETILNRIKLEDYRFQLENHTLGDLWARDVIQGGIAHE